MKVNANGFTDEEQAELDQADKEVDEQIASDNAAKDAPAESEPEGEDKPASAAPQGADKGKPPSGYVPQQALHEIRKELQEEREKRARMEGAWQTIQARLNGGQPQQPQQQPQKQPEVPEFDKDPLTNLQVRLQQAEQRYNDLLGQQQKQTETQRQQAQFTAVMNHYAQDMSAFSRETPEFTEAYKWLETNADAEVAARFPWLTPQQRQQVLMQEENALVIGALQNGRRPAEVVFNLAKHRGYKKAEPQPEENKLERLQKGQKAAASLSATKGGGNANGESSMTLETLAELMVSDPDAADKLWDKMSKRGMLG